MKTILCLLSLCILLGTLSGCSSDQAATDIAGKRKKLQEMEKNLVALQTEIKTLREEIGLMDTSRKEKLQLVKVISLQKAPFSHDIQVQGKVESKNVLNIGSSVGGIITAMHTEEGRHVTKNQLLFETDVRVLEQQMAEVKTQIELATIVFEKQDRLWKQKIGTEIQYITAKKNKEAMENRLATLQEQMKLSRVYAPIGGTVERILSKAGELAIPGMPVINVVGFGNYKVVVDVAESYAGSIKPGGKVKLTFPDFNREMTATILTTSSLIDPFTRTYQVEISIPEVIPGLKPNNVCYVTIQDYHSQETLAVPVNIVQNSETGEAVYITDGSSGNLVAKKVPIKTGKTSRDKVEILEGLKPGDQIITVGYQDLFNGQKIQLVP